MSDRTQNAVIAIPLDEESFDRLMGLSRDCGRPMADLAADLLHDLLEEDEQAHILTAARPPTSTLN